MTKAADREGLKAAQASDGKLIPERRAAARKPSNPLHDYFEWDDSKAGHKFRLWQARELIANVTIVRDEKAEKPVPVFVSLMRDRVDEGGGYRALEEVLADEQMRGELLATALHELKAFQQRYHVYRELAGIFAEVAKLDAKISRKGQGAEGGRRLNFAALRNSSRCIAPGKRLAPQASLRPPSLPATSQRTATRGSAGIARHRSTTPRSAPHGDAWLATLRANYPATARGSSISVAA
jgi:hypothetical protein